MTAVYYIKVMFIPKSVLCVVAHPDDIEFCCGGSIQYWIENGASVSYLICSDGAQGTSDVSVAGNRLRDTRRKEQKNAADILGVSDVTFLDYPDCGVETTDELRKDIVREIRRIKPDTVFTMDPTFYYYQDLHYLNHRDHRAVGQATFDAVYPMARDASCYPELNDDQHQPHAVSTLLMTHLGVKQCHYVDIEPYFETKMNALFCHESQIGNRESARHFFEHLAEHSAKGSDHAMAESFIKLDIRT